MRSAQSRLSVLTALSSARRSAGGCVEALPVSLSSLKVGGAIAGGLGGALLMRGLFSASRRKAKVAAACGAGLPAPRLGLGGYLLSETVLTLLLPLCRRLLLGDNSPASAWLDRLSGKGR